MEDHTYNFKQLIGRAFRKIARRTILFLYERWTNLCSCLKLSEVPIVDTIESFPFRQNIEILPADPVTKITFQDKIVITSRGITRRKQNGLNLGWTVKEVVGIGIVNPRGVSK